MSYRLISSNNIAIKYPEVNDMPCIYADLPNGMDGEHYVLEQEPKIGHWIKYSIPRCGEQHYKCTSCGYYINFGQWGELYTKEFKYCPNCGCRMVESQESEDKCKNCEYYRNPDYTRCHECKAESEDKECLN